MRVEDVVFDFKVCLLVHIWSEKASQRELLVGGFSKPTARYGHSLVKSGDCAILFGGLAEANPGGQHLKVSFPEPAASVATTTDVQTAAPAAAARCFGCYTCKTCCC